MRQMRNRFQKLKIGLIGDGVHSKRIQKILKSLKLKFIIYKPQKNKIKKKYAHLKDLEKCNTIFIISPNDSHFFYINKFKNKSYVFCEKPPTNIKKEILKLQKVKYENIYFNYNFRYSKLGTIIQEVKKYNLGDLLYGNIVTSHNLAQKKIYKYSWRSRRKNSPKGVFEIVTIHWVDFVNYYFKIKKILNINLRNSSKVGSSFDNSNTTILLKNRAQIDIFSSYDAPFCYKSLFVFRNGIIENDDKSIKIFGPANNFDKNGFSIKPKIIRSYIIDENKDYINSIKLNVIKFLKIASSKKKFSEFDFKTSLSSNKLLF